MTRKKLWKSLAVWTLVFGMIFGDGSFAVYAQETEPQEMESQAEKLDGKKAEEEGKSEAVGEVRNEEVKDNTEEVEEKKNASEETEEKKNASEETEEKLAESSEKKEENAKENTEEKTEKEDDADSKLADDRSQIEEETEQSSEITEKISPSVHNEEYEAINIKSDGPDRIQHGASLNLIADISGTSIDDEGNIGPADTKDVRYIWEYKVNEYSNNESEEISAKLQLNQDPNNSAKCQIITPADVQLEYTITLLVRAYKGDEEISVGGKAIYVTNFYRGLEPYSIVTNIYPGETTEIEKLGVYRYESWEKTLVPNQAISFEYDPEVFEITLDGNLVQSGSEPKQEYAGQTFKLKRLSPMKSDIIITAWVKNEEGKWSELDSACHSFGISFFYEVDFVNDTPSTMFASDDPEENDIIDFELDTSKLEKEHTVEWSVGESNEYDEFTSLIEPDNYTVSGNKLTLNANRIKKVLEEKNLFNERFHLDIRAYIKIEGIAVAIYDRKITLEEPWYRLDHVYDMTDLIGTDRTFDKRASCWIENKKYPYGAEFSVTISEIIIDQPENEPIWKIEEYGDRFVLKALACGSAAVTFKTVSEKLGETDFTVNMSVTDHTYRINIDNEYEYWPLLAGDSKKLEITVEREYYDSTKGEICWEKVENALQYITYDDYDENIITVAKDGTVTANPEIKDEHAYINVHLSIPEAGQANFECDRTVSVDVKNHYFEVFAESMCLEPGETVVSFPIKLMKYDFAHKEGIEIKDFTYQLADMDERTNLINNNTGFTVKPDIVDGDEFAVEIHIPSLVTEDESAISGCFSVKVCKHNYKVKSEAQKDCTEAGKRIYECTKCHKTKEESIPKSAHNFVIKSEEQKDCTAEGTRLYECTKCHAARKEAIARTTHNFVLKSETKSDCFVAGKKIYECTKCHATKEEAVPKPTHSYGKWKTTTPATIFKKGVQTRTCTICKGAETKTISRLKSEIKLNASSVTLKVNQSTKKLEVTFTEGDSVKSWTSSNKKIVTVSGKSGGKCTIKAGKKTGTAYITIKTKAGAFKKVTVKVQKGKISTKSIKNVPKTIKIKKGKSYNLSPSVQPITSTDKVKYSSKDKKIATVSAKGVIKGKKAGKTKITVTAGKKKVSCTVTVKK